MAAIVSTSASDALVPQAKKIASIIVSRLENIKIIYDSIVKAAEIAHFKIYDSRDAAIIQRLNTTFLLPSSQLRDKQYDSRVAEQSNDYKVLYDPQDITIVGGAALNIYDSILHPFKIRHRIGQLDQYIKKSTADMDMTWWPTIITSVIEDWVVVSSSPAIQLAITMFEKELVSYLNAPAINNAFVTMFGPSLKEYGTLAACRVEVENLPEPLAGISNISISFHLSFHDNSPILLHKLCEIAMHDGGASQKYNEKGKEITTLQPMQMDPVYCTAHENTSHLVVKKSKIPKSKDTISVPSMIEFIKQQLFAFGNHIYADKKDSASKAFVHYKRIMYLRKLLHAFDVTSYINMESFKILRSSKHHASLSGPAYLSKIIETVDKLIEYSLVRLQPRIKHMCQSHPSYVSDPIVHQLCEIMSITSVSDEDELQSVKMEIKALNDYAAMMRDMGLLEQEPRRKQERMQKYHLVSGVRTEFRDKCLKIANLLPKHTQDLMNGVSKNTLKTDASTLYMGTKLNMILFDYEILLENINHVRIMLTHKYNIAKDASTKQHYKSLLSQADLFNNKIVDILAPYVDLDNQFAYLDNFEPVVTLIEKNAMYHHLKELQPQLYRGFNILSSASLDTRDPVSALHEWAQVGMSFMLSAL